MKRIGLVLAVIVFVVTLILSIGVVFWWKDGDFAPLDPVRQKSFSRLVAEGVRYRDYQNLGVDRFAFKSCRVEKRRKGAITFGALNVLVVDGLVLNLPAEASLPGGGAAAGGTVLGERKDEGLADMLLRSQGLGVGRVSGLRINGLTVNRCSTNGVSFVFSAAKAESGMGKGELRLRECVVRTPEGKEVPATEARLVLQPALALVYMQGGAEHRVEL
jgi:hypothetical protein